jgi:hypothetical protein
VAIIFLLHSACKLSTLEARSSAIGDSPLPRAIVG